VKGKSAKAKKAEKKSNASEAEKRLQMRVQKMKDSDFRKKLWHKRRAELKVRSLTLSTTTTTHTHTHTHTQASLAREQRHSKTNLLKIQNQWRKVMRLAKVQSLRRDLTVLAQSHERDVDRKDALVQMLDRDLEEAEEQYQMALRSHMSQCDELIDLQDSRLLSMENDFKRELAIIVNEFEKEKKEVSKKNDTEVDILTSTVESIHSMEKKDEVERRHDHERQREDIKNKHLEDINVLRITLENHIEELEKQFEMAHMKYLQSTDEQTQEFKNLTRTDLEQSKQIDHKIRRIERLQASRNHMLAKINQNTRECEERNKDLEEQKHQIVAHCDELKDRMNQFRQDQSRRLKRLTKNARKCKDTLKSHRDLANEILKLAEQARKYETERERVLPFENDFVSAKEEEEGKEEQDVTEFEELKASIQRGLRVNESDHSQHHHHYHLSVPKALDAEGKEVEEWNYLDVFFGKFNRVLMDKLATEQERDRLLKENQDLQSVLKQYLDGISVNSDVMNRENPLLVVNNRLSLNRSGPSSSNTNGSNRVPVSRIPVKIDGRHMVNTGRASTRAM